MPLVVGVEFKPVTKVYYFDPAGHTDLKAGERVVVDTARGRTLGEVVIPPHEVPGSAISGTLKPVLRRATALDMVQQDQSAHRERDAFVVCKERAAALRLDMKIVKVEYNFDGGSLLVYFTAEQRIDFRALVHELAQVLHTRVEMRQIGVRDEAKFLSGFGRCGRQLCCAAWLREFAPVSIKMAKQQDLPLNPQEISGVCGRLLCCLSYENEFYGEVRRHLPKVNSTLMTPQGPGKVRQVHVLRNSVTVLVEGANDTTTLVEIPLGELDLAGAPDEGCAGCGAKRQILLASSDESDALDAGDELVKDEGHPEPEEPRRPVKEARPAPSRRSRSRRRARGGAPDQP